MVGFKRINLTVTPKEFDALVRLAIAEHRDPKQQASYFIREGLERHGLIDPITLRDSRPQAQGVQNGN